MVYDGNSLIKDEFKNGLHVSENSPNIDPAELARLSSKNDDLNGSPTGRLEVILRFV
jgi:hypothetical protein